MKTTNFDEIGMSDFVCEGDYFEKVAPANGQKYFPEEIDNLIGSSNWRVVALPTNDIVFYNHETIAGSRNFVTELFVDMTVDRPPRMYGKALVIDGNHIHPLTMALSKWGKKIREGFLSFNKEILLSATLREIHPKNKKHYSLQECQKYVGGPIELISISYDKYMVVNEEGALRTDLGVNIMASAIAQQIIIGNVMIIKKTSLEND